MIVVLDVGGSSVKAGVVDGHQPVGEATQTPIDCDGGRDDLLDRLAAAATALPPTDRVALAIPEPFDYERGVSWMTHKFAALHGVAVADELRRRLPHRPIVRCCNDAAAAVVGEAIAGAGVGRARVLGLTLGTGLGAAFVVDGHQVAEEHGIVAGDLYARVLDDGRAADDAFSARAFVDALATGATTPEAFGADFGAWLAPIVRDLRADVVLLGGGGIASFDRFGPSLAARLDVPVEPAQLGTWAPLIGGAAICFG